MSLFSRLAKTPASELCPGDRGIGLVDLGDGRPFGIAVTVVGVEEGLARVRDGRGRVYGAPSLLGVGEDVDAVLLVEEEREAWECEEARRALYRARVKRRVLDGVS